MFPVLNDSVLKAVPFAFLEKGREQALRNHGQTLERLHQRGGLDPAEMLCIVRGQSWSYGASGVGHLVMAEVRVALLEELCRWEKSFFGGSS